jgi:hypothetical protein
MAGGSETVVDLGKSLDAAGYGARHWTAVGGDEEGASEPASEEREGWIS